ncbi:MAG: hypothetical protein AAF266_04055 [Planctomycetota bacterium]
MESGDAPPTIAFVCVACGVKYRVAAAHAGRKTKCTKCRAELTVPSLTAAAADPFAHLVSFGCRLCGTRLSAPARNAGKKVRCRDCETLTTIPTPEAPAAPNRPAAMDGEQYEVYEGEQPHGIDLARASVPSIRFACHVCQTPLSADYARVGELVPCPDCRAETRVPQPPKPERRRKRGRDEGYEVDTTVAEDSAEKKTLFEEYASKPPVGYRGDTDETKSSRREQRDAKPATARGWGIGLFDGLLRAFSTTGMALAWLGLSASLVFTAPMLGFTMGLLGQIGGLFGIIGVVLLIGATVAVTMLWVGVASSILWAVLDGASAGARRINSWPSIDPTEWFGPTLSLLFATVVASIPGYALAQAFREQVNAPAPFDSTIAWVVVGAWLTLPWVLLSQLDNSSPWAVFSPSLVRTLRHAPVTWLTFYAVTLALIVVVYDLSAAADDVLGFGAVFVMCPVEVAADLLYFWLLGRLAWIAGSKTPDVLTTDGTE